MVNFNFSSFIVIPIAWVACGPLSMIIYDNIVSNATKTFCCDTWYAFMKVNLSPGWLRKSDLERSSRNKELALALELCKKENSLRAHPSAHKT